MKNIARRQRRVLQALGLDSQTDRLGSLQRDIDNLTARLEAVGVKAGTKKPKDSPASKALKALNVPGAIVRGGIKAAIDPEYDLTDISPYSNPVSGIDLLDQLGLAPEEGPGFGRKAARFGLGLVTDIATDPINLFAGGITRPLELLKFPVIGGVAKTLTKQGVAQPFFRGVGAGLRGTGALGAALGDEGVVAARSAAAKAAKGELAPLSDNAREALRQSKEAIETSLTNRAPRALTKAEQLGLGLGTKAKENDIARGVVSAFSPRSLTDPVYNAARNTLSRNVSKATRKGLGELDKLVASLTPEKQRLVADLLESSGERAKYGLESFAPNAGVHSPTSIAREDAEKLLGGDTATWEKLSGDPVEWTANDSWVTVDTVDDAAARGGSEFVTKTWAEEYVDRILAKGRSIDSEIASLEDLIARATDPDLKREWLEFVDELRKRKAIPQPATSTTKEVAATTMSKPVSPGVFPSGRKPGTRLPNLDEAEAIGDIKDMEKGIQLLTAERQRGISEAAMRIAKAEEKAGRFGFSESDINFLAERRFDASKRGEQIAEQIATLNRRRDYLDTLRQRTAGTGTRTVGNLADEMAASNLQAQRTTQSLTSPVSANPPMPTADPLNAVREAQTKARQLRLGDAQSATNISSTLYEDVPLEQLPEDVYNVYKYMSESLKHYGNERVKRGLLGALIDNYFPHKLNPDLVDTAGGVSATATKASQQSANFRDVSRNRTLKEMAKDPLAPKFEQEAVRPFAKELIESERSIQVFDFFEEMKGQMGISVDDMAKQYGFAPSVKMPDVVGDYKLVDFAAFMNKGRQSEAYGKLGRVYLPSNVADDLTKLHSAYMTDEGINTFVKMWDGLTNFWKPLVTVYNPGFHINNMFGNVWNSYLGGLTNPTRYRDGYDVYFGRAGSAKAGNYKLDFGKLNELANKKGVIDSGFFEAELGRDGYRLAREGLPKPISESNIRKAAEWVTEKGRKAGNFFEGTSRASLFVDQMIKKVERFNGQLTDEVLDKFAGEASDHVNKYLFDYAHGLSKFENDIVRRAAPFYSWSRHNIPRQVIELIDQPGKFLLYKHVKDNLTKLNPYPDDTPPWLREALPTGVNIDGSPLFFNPKLPLQDISRLAPGDSGRELLGMLNPLIKTPLELGFNKSLYTGREIEQYEGQTTGVIGGGRLPVKPVYAVNSVLGVLGKAGTPLQAFAPDADVTDKLRMVRAVFPGVYSYDTQKQPINNAYTEVNRLRDLLRKFEDESQQQVPTMSELRRGR